MLLAVSNTLQRYLQARVSASVSIVALQQDEPLNLPVGTIALFLYGVEENAHMRNRGPVAASDGTFRRPPLALTLHYLVTYISAAATDTQEWLSQVLRVLPSQTRIARADLDPALAASNEFLAVRLRSLTPEEVQRLWTALNLGMRLSLYYEVDAAFVEPFEPKTTGPVRRRDVVLAQGVA